MKFDLLGFYLSAKNKYLSILSIMVNRLQPDGSTAPGLTRHLLFVSYDPIGWRFQLLFRIFFYSQYERKYGEYMWKLRYPNGYPRPTKGLKIKQAKEITMNPLTPEESTQQP